MVLYVDETGGIHDVGTTDDESLTAIEVLDTESANPFLHWSVAKICCYRCAVSNKVVVMMTPRVDSKLIEHIDQLGKQGDMNTSDISDNREGIMETYEETSTNTADVADLREAVMELYEMISGMEV